MIFFSCDLFSVVEGHIGFNLGSYLNKAWRVALQWEFGGVFLTEKTTFSTVLKYIFSYQNGVFKKVCEGVLLVFGSQDFFNPAKALVLFS